MPDNKEIWGVPPSVRLAVANSVSFGTVEHHSGFVWVLENLESPGILLWHFLGLESPGKGLLVLESARNLLNSNEKYEMYGRQ